MAYQFTNNRTGYGSSSSNAGQAGSSAAAAAARVGAAGRPPAEEDEYEDEEDYDEDSFNNNNNNNMNRGGDKIRRNYLQQQGTNFSFDNRGPIGTGEAIHVKLNEGYFSNEKKVVVDFLANVRSKLNTVQMFNPAKNNSNLQQQETWNDKVSRITFKLTHSFVYKQSN